MGNPETLEPRWLLACDLAEAEPQDLFVPVCLSPGGELNDGALSLEYEPTTGALSIRADGEQLSGFRVQSRGELLRYPNGTPWAGEFDTATGFEMTKQQFTNGFGDIIAMGSLPKGLSEYDVISELFVSAHAQQRSFSKIDLIYPRLPDKQEPNGDAENPTRLSSEFPSLIDQSLHERGDEDWFVWTAEERGRLSVEVFFEHATGDAELELYDERLNLIEWSSTTRRNEAVQREVVAGETYLIRVFGFADATQSTYDIVTYLVPEEEPIYVLSNTEPVTVDRYSHDLLMLGAPLVLSAVQGDAVELELGPNGLMYVLSDDAFSDAIYEFTPKGVLTRKIDLPPDVGPIASPAGFEVLADGSFLIAQPNQQRSLHISRQEVIEGIYFAGERLADVTVVMGPQASLSDRQWPLWNSAPGVASISPTINGGAWLTDAADHRLIHLNSDGTPGEFGAVAASAPIDVQQAANQRVWSIDREFGGTYLRRRELGEPAEAAPFSFAWVNRSTTSSFVASPTYSYNAAGGAVNVTRNQTGTYRVQFDGLRQLDSSGGNVQVTAYGGGNSHCAVSSWGDGDTAADFAANVRCYDASGALADQQFNIMVTHSSNQAHIAYAWAGQSTTANYRASSTYAHNPGGAVDFTRTATGQYRATFRGLETRQLTGGHVQVTPYGSAGNRCGVTSWGRSATDFVASIACVDASGLPADSMYSIAVLPRSHQASSVAYAWLSFPNGDETASTIYGLNASGEIEKTRQSQGRYQVRFRGINSSTAVGGHVQVSNYGQPATHCGVVNWFSSGSDLTANVECYSASGLADARFNILVTPTPAEFTHVDQMDELLVNDAAVSLALADAEFPVIMPGEPTDRDGDGLFDLWETQGIDVNHDGVIDLDLPSMGADPDRKDLFVEVDWLDGFRPSNDTLSRVEQAFANTEPGAVYNPDGSAGIKLHWFVDELIPATDELSKLPEDVAETWKVFDEIKANHFGSPIERSHTQWEQIQAAKQQVFRYAFFGDERGHRPHIGLAELPGQDMLLTFGGLEFTPSSQQQAGVIMHELGHLLGLAHGGDDHQNYKRNYLSVMNYRHLGGDTLVDGEPLLSFSTHNHHASTESHLVEPLDELALDEVAGWGFFAATTIDPLIGPAIDGDQPYDWNGDGDTDDLHVAYDVNRNRREGELHKSYNDYRHLIFDFRNYHRSSEGGPLGTNEIVCDEPEHFVFQSGMDQYECNDHREDAADIYDGNPLDEDIDDILTLHDLDDVDWFILESLFDGTLAVNLESTDGTPAEAFPLLATIVTTDDVELSDGVSARRPVDAGQSVYVRVEWNPEMPPPSSQFIQYRLAIDVPDTTSTWIGNGVAGAAGKSWDDPVNWGDNRIPGANDTVVFPATSNDQVDLNGIRQTGELRVEGDVGFNNGRLEIGGHFTVTGSIEVQLDAGDSGVPLEVGGDASLVGGSSLAISSELIAGGLAAGEHVFDVLGAWSLVSDAALPAGHTDRGLFFESLSDSETTLSANYYQAGAGDANGDRIFNSTDLIIVFAAGLYEDETPDNAGWTNGDWNHDSDFDSGDLVVAFSTGSYLP